MKGVVKLWAQVPHTNTSKNVHINMYPETIFELELIQCMPQHVSSWTAASVHKCWCSCR